MAWEDRLRVGMLVAVCAAYLAYLLAAHVVLEGPLVSVVSVVPSQQQQQQQLRETMAETAAAAAAAEEEEAECGCANADLGAWNLLSSEEMVDDCLCDSQTVEDINARMRPALLELLHTPFFNFFRVHMDRPCQFWNDYGMCFRASCSVEECPENELPEAWRQTKYSQLGSLTRSLDNGAPDFMPCECSDKDFCYQDHDDDEGCIFIKLSDNPEAFTGYEGDSARKIWSAIYTENCFSNADAETCSEKRIFYRIISGLHASIGAHLAEKYFDKDTEHWIFNVSLFEERVANYPARVKNIYFTYLVILRAIAKASDYLRHYDFSTGTPELDDRTAELVRGIGALVQGIPHTFDELGIFTDDNSEFLKEEFKLKFRNISRIMDCVTCEKCKLWGKLQVLGLGTALKILFSYDSNRSEASVNYELTRNEITALVNVLGRFSDSIRAYCEYKEIKLDQLRRAGIAAPAPAPSRSQVTIAL